MYNEGRNNRRLYVASFSDDAPLVRVGSLIPKRTLYSAPKEVVYTKTVWYLQPTILLTLSVLLFAVSIGTTSYSVLRGQTSVAAPAMSDVDLSYTPDAPQYGIALALGEDNTFTDTRDVLIATDETFLAVDLVSMTLTYYEEGAAKDTMEILSKGEDGSWWKVPAGLYEVDQKKKVRYSSFGNIYMPWSVSFEGNFYINGVPYYQDGEDVPEEYTGGGIRLANDDAERVFNSVALGTHVLVHEENFEADGFVYTAKIPGLSATEYLVADLESNTVLALSDVNKVAPIASLVKLMTALVAAEHIDLDRDVYLGNKSSFVTTLIPRLAGSNSASMYSLLQLLLMESSNEAADAIADSIGRSDFIALMNEKVETLGMTATTFTDPSGLDDGNVSTVEDLLTLVQYINHTRGFILELTADQNLPTAYTNGQFGKLANFNEIEGVDFIAGKVGETNAAGQTSVSLHEIQIDGEARTVVIILLGSAERSADIQRMYTFVDEQFN